MKFYIGQPVIPAYNDNSNPDIRFFNPDELNPRRWKPAPGLPNVWYQWDGGTKPPCGPEQDVLILQPGDGYAWLAMTKVVDWANVEWYMIIKAPEVVR